MNNFRTRRHGIRLCAAILGLAASNQADALVINATFDSNWLAGAPTAATAAVNAVDAMFGSMFSNPGTVNITFGWNDLAGTAISTNTLGVTTFNNAPLYSLTYITSLMQNYSLTHPQNAVLSSVVSHLPASVSNPGGSPNFFIPDAVYTALTGANVAGVNAYVGFGGGVSWQYSQTGGIAAGAYDFTGVALHEIAHTLGRVNYEFVTPSTPYLTPLDLTRYTCGATQLNSTSGSTACFSINGGTTDLATYSPTSDSADLNGATIDPFNAYMNPGTAYTMTAVGGQIMQSLGWTLASSVAVPEPGTLFLFAPVCAAVAYRRRTRAPAPRP